MIKKIKSKLLTYLFTDWVKSETDLETIKLTSQMLKNREIEITGIKNKTFIKEGIFIALGYGFNLYDIKIAKKAALEGCERMRRANKIENTCKCEMVLYNDDILVKHQND